MFGWEERAHCRLEYPGRRFIGLKYSGGRCHRNIIRQVGANIGAKNIELHECISIYVPVCLQYSFGYTVIMPCGCRDVCMKNSRLKSLRGTRPYKCDNKATGKQTTSRCSGAHAIRIPEVKATNKLSLSISCPLSSYSCGWTAGQSLFPSAVLVCSAQESQRLDACRE